MAQALTINKSETVTLADALMLAVLAPAAPAAAQWLRIYSTSAVELVNSGTIADGEALPTDTETLPGGSVHWRNVRRGEVGIFGAAAQDVEIGWFTREGPG